MEEIKSYNPGTFCWVDISSTDPEASKEFYTEIFGWEYKDQDLGDGMIYSQCFVNGKTVAGLGPLPPEMQNQGIPSFWLPYVKTDNVDETLNAAQEAGGAVMMPAMDVFEEGRLAVITDPEGAALGLWQPKNHTGMSYKNIHGTFCWAEHSSHDQSKSTPFLEKVFGWTSQVQQMGPMEYTLFMLGEEQVGGSYVLPEEMSQIPSFWLIHFDVDNIDETIEKAISKGANIIVPKTQVPGVGHIVIFQDPQGAGFGVLQADPQ